MSGSGDVEATLQLCNTKTKQWTWCGVFAAVSLTLLILLATSLKKLKSTEYGLQYTGYSKKLDDAAKVGGLHVGPPGYEFIKFPSTQITVDLPRDTCVSKDGLRIVVSVSFQYQMPAEWLLPAVVKYRNFPTWAQVVEAAGNSAVHHSCSEFTIAQFQRERGVIQSTMEANLKVKLEGDDDDDDNDDRNNGVYARAVSLQLQNVELPAEYSKAVAEKQAAAEDIALAKNQRNQEVTKADTAYLTAKEEAKIINSTSVNTAEIFLTEALSKAQETTFAFETEANLIVSVQQSLGLTVDGVLGWLSNQLLASAPTLYVSTAEPASLSRKTAL